VLRVKGKDFSYEAIAIENQPEEIKKWLVIYLGKFPQDAAYQDIKLNKDKNSSGGRSGACDAQCNRS
jgi:hypothetical protein